MSTQSHFDISMISHVLNKIVEMFHFKFIFAFLLMCFSWVFGNDYQVLISIYVLLFLDTFTGVWFAIKQKELHSRGFYRAAIKSFIYLVMLVVSRIIDKHMPITAASSIMEGFLVITEAISILENISKLGFPVPIKLVKILKTYYDKKQ